MEHRADAVRPLPRWLPFAVPPLYLAAILTLQPADQLGEPAAAPWLGRLVYDDFDETAYVLRAVNATAGRQAGRLSEPASVAPEAFNEALKAPADPGVWEERYFLEYPHAALWLFRLGYILPPDVRDVPVPGALLDAYHLNVVQHDPAGDSERIQRLWRKFRAAIRLYEAFAVACLLGLMMVLTVSYEPGGRRVSPIILLCLPATLYFAANRFDIVPALLTALSLACLGRQRVVASAVFLGAATLVKVYPVLLTLLFVRYLSDRPRRAAAWTLAYGLTVAGVFGLTIGLEGWQAAVAPFRFQLSRTLEGLTLYGYVLPRSLGESTQLGSLFRLGTLGVAMLLTAWRRPGSLDGLLRRAAVVLLVFVSIQVFYSPQWIVWLMPLLVPLAARRPSILLLLAGLDVVTYLTFPVVYDTASGVAWYRLMAGLVVLRALFLFSLAAVLIRDEWGGPQARFGLAK